MTEYQGNFGAIRVECGCGYAPGEPAEDLDSEGIEGRNEDPLFKFELTDQGEKRGFEPKRLSIIVLDLDVVVNLDTLPEKGYALPCEGGAEPRSRIEGPYNRQLGFLDPGVEPGCTFQIIVVYDDQLPARAEVYVALYPGYAAFSAELEGREGVFRREG